MEVSRSRRPIHCSENITSGVVLYRLPLFSHLQFVERVISLESRSSSCAKYEADEMTFINCPKGFKSEEFLAFDANSSGVYD